MGYGRPWLKKGRQLLWAGRPRAMPYDEWTFSGEAPRQALSSSFFIYSQPLSRPAFNCVETLPGRLQYVPKPGGETIGCPSCLIIPTFYYYVCVLLHYSQYSGCACGLCIVTFSDFSGEGGWGSDCWLKYSAGGHYYLPFSGKSSIIILGKQMV